MFSTLSGVLPTKTRNVLVNSLNAVSDACYFVVTHPLEAITMGLAAQSAAVMACSQSVVSLSTLNGQTGFELTGVAESDLSGSSVGTAGDVNGDGIADFIIGAYGANNYAGASYVVFGHQGPWTTPLSLAGLEGTRGFELTGVDVNDQSGFSVGTTGDVNGDGIADFIIGAYGANNYAGASYVVFGHQGPWTTPLSLSSLNGTNGFALAGVAARDYSGTSVGTAGDVNGDGIADVIIGASEANNGAGASYVVFGHQGPWTTPLSLSSLNGTNGFALTGIDANDYSGIVGAAGDVNGDGIADVIVGAYGANNETGASYMVFGSLCNPEPTSGSASAEPSIALGIGLFWLMGLAPSLAELASHLQSEKRKKSSTAPPNTASQSEMTFYCDAINRRIKHENMHVISKDVKRSLRRLCA